MAILNHPVLVEALQRHATRNGGAFAVFDCDGTLIRGDIGEAMLYHQIRNFLFRVSPAAVWPDHPRADRLDELFVSLSHDGSKRTASGAEFQEFAGTILDWYFGQIDGGKVAKACTDIVRLWAGFPLGEVRTIAARSFTEQLASPVTTGSLGGRTIPQGVRYIRQSLEILRALQRSGIAIWAVSGSSRWSVEPVFERVGIPRDQVIGIETVEHHGTLTAREILPIPIREGKVEALRAKTTGAPVLVASDSRNDIPLLLASCGVKVRVNSRGRSSEEFFAAVGSPADESWICIEEPESMPTAEVQ